MSWQSGFEEIIQTTVPLAPHTWFRLGGPADVWLSTNGLRELVEAVDLARQHQVPLFILGGGANLLIGDEAFIFIGRNVKKLAAETQTA